MVNYGVFVLDAGTPGRLVAASLRRERADAVERARYLNSNPALDNIYVVVEVES